MTFVGCSPRACTFREGSTGGAHFIDERGTSRSDVLPSEFGSIAQGQAEEALKLLLALELSQVTLVLAYVLHKRVGLWEELLRVLDRDAGTAAHAQGGTSLLPNDGLAQPDFIISEIYPLASAAGSQANSDSHKRACCTCLADHSKTGGSVCSDAFLKEDDTGHQRIADSSDGNLAEATGESKSSTPERTVNSPPQGQNDGLSTVSWTENSPPFGTPGETDSKRANCNDVPQHISSEPRLKRDEEEGFESKESLFDSNMSKANNHVSDGSVRQCNGNSEYSSKQNAMHNKGTATIQFSAFIYYCEEEEQEMVVDVIRIGRTDIASSVHYQTRDKSAKAGVRYHHREGVVEFPPGEVSVPIRIPICSNNSFDATLEFEVVLSNPVNANLGRYLYRCRVKVDDDDSFPTNKYRAILRNQNAHQIPRAKLLLEYFKMNFSDHIVRKGTLQSFSVDVLHNVYFIWRLNLLRFLIDTALNTEKDPEELPVPDRISTLALVMAGVILPYPLLHFLDVRRLRWHISGQSRTLLQANLLRKFLNYNEASRQKFQESNLIMAMTRDIDNLVGHGYLMLMPLVKDICRLSFLLMQIIVAPLTWGGAPDPFIVCAFLIFPALMAIFLRIRNNKTVRLCLAKNLKENQLVSQIHETVMNYSLIADFNRRPHFVDLYETRIQDLNHATVMAGIATLNNKYFAPWLSSLIIGFYMVWGGAGVLREGLTLGSFMISLDIVMEVGVLWGDVYSILLEFQGVLPSISHIVTYMNLPTDVGHRMKLNRKRREILSVHHATSRASIVAVENQEPSGKVVKNVGIDPHDALPIQVTNMRYRFGNPAAIDGVEGSFDIRQGSFVALVGLRGQGKSTMLKLLCGHLLPEGGLNIPPHLRVLHTPEMPLFFEGSILQNLRFGVEENDKDGELDRVKAICRKLLISEPLIESMAGEIHDFQWFQALSLTQRFLLHLARSLITNPEVLCIHRPTQAFDRDSPEFDNTLNLLRRFVDERGLEQDPETKFDRRPRTCIVTAGTRAAQSDIFDSVFRVEGMKGVKQLREKL